MSHLSLLMYKKFLVTTLLAEVGKGGKQRFRVYHTGQFRITSISGGDFEVRFLLGENFHPAKSSLLGHNPGQKTQTVSTLSRERPEIHDGSSCNVSTAVTIAVPELEVVFMSTRFNTFLIIAVHSLIGPMSCWRCEQNKYFMDILCGSCEQKFRLSTVLGR
ncbi:hypothetical protein RRG08_051583 [Elysia crispata]|uniref:Uncharacterized protein n=1 Tax=Elysia crispata TaxID=231223 RepID=A0AAE1DRY2_9GAST|nr:hypothetical protein RRG08_051583 [Elysia crispata]